MKLIFAILCAIATDVVLAEDARPLSASAAIHWQQFSRTLSGAKQVALYVGTPRRLARDAKPTEPTIEIEDFEFYHEPTIVSQEHAERLTKLVSDARSFADYRGMKLCGGFHPDFCIEWRFEAGGQRWHQRAFVCLDCDEWRLIDKRSAVHTDMPKAAAEEVVRIVRAIRGQSQ